MVALQQLPADAGLTAVLEVLRTDGACIILDLLSQDTCDALVADFGPHLQSQTYGIDELGYRNDFYGNQTKRLHGLFSKSPVMVDVLTHPLLLDVAEGLLCADQRARDVRLSNTELMVLGNGQGNQEFHTDSSHRLSGHHRHSLMH